MARKRTLLEVFAANMRRLREEKKLTQSVMAERAGLSISYVSMLERGQRSPPLDTVEKVALALKEPAAKLFVEQ